MTAINGIINRVKPTDLYQRCKKCGRVFYFDRDCNGKRVKCPYCGTAH